MIDMAALRVGPYSIGPPLILAPMAGVSELPFRLLALEMGATFAPTELVSAKGLLHKSARTEAYLCHDKSVERPFCVQLFGGEPDTMAHAAEVVARAGADIIDINMGCPVKKVVRTGAGSALLTEPRRAAAIVRGIIERVGLPVTAKIRLGWDDCTRNAVEVAQILEDAGVQMIAVHARTRSQGYAGRADWDSVRDVSLAVRIPVVVNGDIVDAASAKQALAASRAAGIMVGRAALGNPWIFRELKSAFLGEPTPPRVASAERMQVILRHFEAHRVHVKNDLRAVKKFREHLIWYSRSFVGSAAFRDRAVHFVDVHETVDAIREFFANASPTTPREVDARDLGAALG